MYVSDAREQYVRWLVVTRDLSPHTIRAYDGDITAFERHLGGRGCVRDIDGEILVGFLESQQAAGLAAPSIRRRASGLRGFCRWLHSRGELPADPWAGTTIALGRSRRLPRLLTSQELDRLLHWLRGAAGLDGEREVVGGLARPHDATTLLAVALMVATGARVSELVGLRCRDIDLPGRTVRIVGKRRRERHVYLTNQWIEGLTRAYLATRDALGIGHPQLLFNRDCAPLTPPAMRRRLAHAAQAAGLGARVTPHMLRHTAATQLIEAGVDIRYIQRLLGHASLTTTEIYTHISDRALRQVLSDADVLGRRLEHR